MSAVPGRLRRERRDERPVVVSRVRPVPQTHADTTAVRVARSFVLFSGALENRSDTLLRNREECVGVG